MDCSAEAITKAHANDQSPVPGQYIDVVCAPPRDPNWHDSLYVSAQVLCLVGLFALVIVMRNRFHETHGRDWRDDI